MNLDGYRFFGNPGLVVILFAVLTEGLKLAPHGMSSSLSLVPRLTTEKELQTIASRAKQSPHLLARIKATASLTRSAAGDSRVGRWVEE